MYKNQQPTPNRPIPEPGNYDLATVLRITMDSFTSATERHIEVGDGLEMFIVRNTPESTAGSAVEATAAQGTSSTTAALDLSGLFGAVEATGGEDEQTPGTTMVVRRELKKD